MTRPDEFAAMTRLTGLMSSAAEARLARHLRRAEELRESLAALEGARRDRALQLTEIDPAHRAGADLRWHRWIDSRRAVLNVELARTMAEADLARAAVAQAFGRKLAAEALESEARTARKLRAAKRFERDQLS